MNLIIKDLFLFINDIILFIFSSSIKDLLGNPIIWELSIFIENKSFPLRSSGLLLTLNTILLFILLPPIQTITPSIPVPLSDILAILCYQHLLNFGDYSYSYTFYIIYHIC